MINRVPISQRSRDLFPLITSALLANEEGRSPESDLLLSWLNQYQSQAEISTLDLVKWLSKTTTLNKEAQFLLESLRATLLQDLFNSIPASAQFPNNVNSDSNEAFFRFLTIAGVIVAICEGFDGIVSIIGLFPVIPQLVTFLAGIVFAGLSVIVFCSFDLVAIARNLGVNIDNTHQLIDVYLDQVEQLNKLRAVVNISYAQSNAEDQKILLQIASMLVTRYAALDVAREMYRSDLNAPYLTTAKLITSAVAGVLFFGAGFFSSQSLVLAVAGLFSSSVSALSWPIIVASSVVGLAAFSIYWFVERPGLESLVSRWRGLDEDKITNFIDDKVVNEQKREFAQLETNLNRFVSSVNQVEKLREQLATLNIKAPHPSVSSSAFDDRFTFFSKSGGDSAGTGFFTEDARVAAFQ